MSHTPLNAMKISQELASTYPRVKVVTEITSTQSEFSNYFSPSLPFDLLIAEFQTHGRGRLNRAFSAPPASALLFSVYLEPDQVKSSWGIVPILIGKSVAEGIRHATGLSPETKWPNDVLINNKKVCGILCETRGSGIIAGIGINVNFSETEIPVPTATSLAIELGSAVNRDELLITVAYEIYARFNTWNANAISINEITSSCSTIGKHVRIELADGSIREGVASAITDGGELKFDSGELFSVGDVTHLR